MSEQKYVKLFEEFVNESNDELNKDSPELIKDYIIDIIEKHFNVKERDFEIKESKTIDGEGFNIAKKSEAGKSNIYTVQFDSEKYLLYLSLYTEWVVDSTSLADDKLAYKNTSAKKVKTQKKSHREYYEDLNKAKKAIDRYFKNLSKKDVNI